MQKTILAVALLLAFACKPRHSEADASDVKFQTFKVSTTAMTGLYNAEKQICVIPTSEKSRDFEANIAIAALRSWFTKLKLFDSSFPDDLWFGCPMWGKYIGVTYSIGCSGHSDYDYSANVAEVCPFDANNQWKPQDTILRSVEHEMGHGFGLNDTYLTATPTLAQQAAAQGIPRQDGQPSSIMNDSSVDEEDEKQGLAAIYAYHFAAKVQANRPGDLSFSDRLLLVLAKTGGNIESRCYYAQQKRYVEALTTIDKGIFAAFTARQDDNNGFLATLENQGYFGANNIGASWRNGTLVVGFTDWGNSSTATADRENTQTSVDSPVADTKCVVAPTDAIVQALSSMPQG